MIDHVLRRPSNGSVPSCSFRCSWSCLCRVSLSPCSDEQSAEAWLRRLCVFLRPFAPRVDPLLSYSFEFQLLIAGIAINQCFNYVLSEQYTADSRRLKGLLLFVMLAFTAATGLALAGIYHYGIWQDRDEDTLYSQVSGRGPVCSFHLRRALWLTTNFTIDTGRLLRYPSIWYPWRYRPGLPSPPSVGPVQISHSPSHLPRHWLPHHPHKLVWCHLVPRGVFPRESWEARRGT